MLGRLTTGNANVSALKSRRAMLDTLLKHLDMVRLSVGFVTALALVGCTGLIPNEQDTTLTPEEKAARTAFIERAKPFLDIECASCHAGSEPFVDFLLGSDAMAQRQRLLEFTPAVVNLEAVASSRILTKGAHAGPALTAEASAAILEWITAEREAAGATGGGHTGLETAAFTPVLCTAGDPGDPTCPITRVDISNLVEGWAGAQIVFVATPLTQDLYVTNLAIEGGPEGVYIEHPLFVSWPSDGGDPIPDSLDRFFNVKINMMPGEEPQQIGGGTAAFINFHPNNQLTIHFKVVDRYRAEDMGSGPGGQTGCKQLESFKANAQTPLQNSCASCHANAGNVNARSAMDITDVGSTDDAQLQDVCNQVRTRINFQDTDNSGFYLAPNPAVQSGHDFKFPTQANFDAFKAAVDVWVQAEKTSP